MKLVVDLLSLLGGSFAQGVQAVLQACDHGLVEIGEKVIMVTGDSAALVTASTTAKFLTRDEGLSIHEIICKPRNFTIARGKPAVAVEQARDLFDQEKLPQLKAAAPKPETRRLEIEGEGAVRRDKTTEPEHQNQK
jgi:uncharacterized cupredoxin-like copper-binding protein